MGQETVIYSQSCICGLNEINDNLDECNVCLKVVVITHQWQGHAGCTYGAAAVVAVVGQEIMSLVM